MFTCDSAEDTEGVHWIGQPHPHVKTGTFVASSLQPSYDSAYKYVLITKLQ